jgi:aryl-alcohol dehydrogenase-like predicted oxidoreductase
VGYHRAHAAEDPLGRLQTDYIDFDYAHRDDPRASVLGARLRLLSGAVDDHVELLRRACDEIGEVLG